MAMNIMDVEKHLSDAFGMRTHVTRHALERIDQRLTLQRLYDLGYLVKAGIRECPIIRLPESFAFVDTGYNLGLVCNKRDNAIQIVTVIHGKPINRYHDTQTVIARIDRERHMEEVEMLRAYQKRTRQLI